MNCLRIEKQEQILNLLVEGCSIRSIERLTGVHRDTIVRLLARVGTACHCFLDAKLTNLTVKEIEVDEIWCYVGKKQKRLTFADNHFEFGDQYVFVAIDPNSKLVSSFIVGKRNGQNALSLMRDLSWRVNCRFQLTTDGYQDASKPGSDSQRDDYLRVFVGHLLRVSTVHGTG